MRRSVSLQAALAAALLLLAAIPATLVAWILWRSSSASVDQLAGELLRQVTAVVQTDTEARLQQPHAVLDALLPGRGGRVDPERARRDLHVLDPLEPAARLLLRTAPDVPAIHLANFRGEYRGVEITPQGMRVASRRGREPGRSYLLVDGPGAQGVAAGQDAAPFEPRTTPWYAAALEGKGRVFTPVRMAAGGDGLVVSLAQPVYDPDGGAAGVVAADLALQGLARMLRTQRISARGGAYIVDERGLLVASSAGDALVTLRDGRAQRTTPAASVNPTIRLAHAAVEALRREAAEDSVAGPRGLQRLPQGDDALLLMQRPFGADLGLRWTLVVAAPESDFTARIGHGMRTAAAGGAALVAAGAVVALLLAGTMARRLRRLSRAAEQLGRGEVPPAEPASRIRELAVLSAVLRDSAQQLRASRRQVESHAQALAHANEHLEQRVRERTAQLEASREEALAAARAKSAFLATISHEIRTPLNGVVGMSTLLAETPLDPEQRDYLQTIRLSSDQLLAVINDVLDFSRIESGRIELEDEPLGLRTVVEEACDIAAPRAREKALELIVDIAHEGPEAVPPAIRGDITRLRQVLINLVNNAVKFTARGEVAVHVRRRPTPGPLEIEFRVTDTGIGIPPERIGSLFQAFTQVDASTTRQYGGSGLGLAICKRLVERMGGAIGVDSAPGRGSSFWFTLPAQDAELPRMESQAEHRLQGVPVLVVDDHATNVRVLARQLEHWGMDVRSAASGPEALALLAAAEGRPALIITDMHMPDMDGIAFTTALRGHARWRDIPVMLLSSGFMPAHHEGAGLFAARLLKPARQGQLLDAIVRCVGAPASGAAPDAPLPVRQRRATVLVADDNAVNLRVACAMLARLGCEIGAAADGRQAVQAVLDAKAGGQPFDAVLMDLNMPELDGIEATRQIRALLGPAAPPVIALTAAVSAHDHARCAEAGMVDYLTKPLQLAALDDALERCLAPVRAAGGGGDGPGAAAAPVEPALLDVSRLDTFREFDDEALTMTREVVALFLADTPPRLAALQTALDAQDASAVATAAHAVKGSAANVGALALAAHAAEVEAAARGGALSAAAPAAAALAPCWVATGSAFEAWLARAPGAV